MARPVIVGDMPWLVTGAVDALEPLLREDMEVFEWGVGGSTIWFAQRVRTIISVEHRPVWKQAVLEKALELDLNNVQIILEVDPKARGYAGAIHRHDPDKTYDVILIDGHVGSRRATTLAASDHWDHRTIVIVDNSGTPEGLETGIIMEREGFTAQDFVGYLYDPPNAKNFIRDKTRTTIWRKSA